MIISKAGSSFTKLTWIAALGVCALSTPRPSSRTGARHRIFQGASCMQLSYPGRPKTTFESRTGRVSKQFLQSPCALSAFSSCSEAMEQLCPIGVMKAELAAAGMSAEAIE
eukprot:scaffold223890_cov26-Tisochrysis_lutea.AAC.1